MGGAPDMSAGNRRVEFACFGAANKRRNAVAPDRSLLKLTDGAVETFLVRHVGLSPRTAPINPSSARPGAVRTDGPALPNPSVPRSSKTQRPVRAFFIGDLAEQNLRHGEAMVASAAAGLSRAWRRGNGRSCSLRWRSQARVSDLLCIGDVVHAS